MIRQAYVETMHRAVSVLSRSGVDRWLSDRRSPIARHLWSLSMIHDVERMAQLDLPWWTYGASREVDQFLASLDGQARVFEYGSGASTMWLGKRAAEVHSVEHDEPFVELMRRLLADQPHVHLYAVSPTERTPTSTAISERAGYETSDFGRYVGVIEDVGGSYDLIVVDGRARATCLERSVKHLSDRGMIVFDNAHRRRYRTAIDASGLGADLLRGWAPCLPYRDTTALLRPAAGA